MFFPFQHFGELIGSEFLSHLSVFSLIVIYGLGQYEGQI